MNQDPTCAIQGHCPVAYFALGEPKLGDPQFASTHDGKVYHFVSSEAKAEFDRHPVKYLPAYGGKCAFGMSIDKEFDACPTNFKIINNRLHLFLKNDDTDALDLWNKEDEAKCIINADKNWSARR